MKEKLSRQFTVRLDESADAELRSLANAHKISAADLIRAAMTEKIHDWKTGGLRFAPTRQPRRDHARATA